jgi:hypothetical protein
VSLKCAAVIRRHASIQTPRLIQHGPNSPCGARSDVTQRACMPHLRMAEQARGATPFPQSDFSCSCRDEMSRHRTLASLRWTLATFGAEVREAAANGTGTGTGEGGCDAIEMHQHAPASHEYAGVCGAWNCVNCVFVYSNETIVRLRTLSKKRSMQSLRTVPG